jgi:starch synthase
MRILFVTSEAFPLIKTGGLADVSGSLPAALQAIDADVRILIPGYPAVLDKLLKQKCVASISNLPHVGSLKLILGEMPDSTVPVITIESVGLYQRDGGPYVDATGKDWEDNPYRFGILSLVAAILSGEQSPLNDWLPDITHCNDWQSGLTPAFMHFMRASGSNLKQAKSVLSIHNLAFQGCYSQDWVTRLGLPAESYQINGLEYYGQLSFLKAGIFYADGLSTVSPTYAQEIQTEAYGFGMQGLLKGRGKEIYGILNGLDTKEWNPATDPHLVEHYDADNLAGKAAVKLALQTKLGLKVGLKTDVKTGVKAGARIPLLGVVSRLTDQKGLDMLLACAESLITEHGCQLALLGSGDASLEQGFRDLAQHFPGQVSVTIGYQEALSHQIMAGCDIFIMPSRFEPCGLNQMYGLRYGTPPVVTHTGGLADSVQDSNEASLNNKTATGFVMQTAEIGQLVSAVGRALGYYRDEKTWRQIQENGMRQDLGWTKSAQAYMAMYQAVLNKN